MHAVLKILPSTDRLNASNQAHAWQGNDIIKSKASTGSAAEYQIATCMLRGSACFLFSCFATSAMAVAIPCRQHLQVSLPCLIASYYRLTATPSLPTMSASSLYGRHQSLCNPLLCITAGPHRGDSLLCKMEHLILGCEALKSARMALAGPTQEQRQPHRHQAL